MSRMRRRALLLACASPLAAHAQTGTVRGVVYDSIVGAPLAGAEVWIERVERTVTTDASGAFVFDRLPPGVHTITFGHPSLDSLGLGAPFGRVDVHAGDTAHVALTTPSMRGIARRLCPSLALDSLGAVLGVVRDVSAGRPIAGAGVSLGWSEWNVRDRNAVERTERELHALADSAGRYVICGVPNDVVVSLRAATAGDSARATGRVLLDVRGRMLTWRNLAIGSSAVEATTGGVVALTVIDERGAPVAGAQARAGATGAFRATSDDGRLRLNGLRTGTTPLEVRAIGYQNATLSVDVPPGRELAQTVRLGRSAVPMLETVRILGARPYRDVTGFEERRRNGFGYYMTNAEIERRVPFRFTDLARRLPGVQVIVPTGNGPLVVASLRASRGNFGSNGRRSICPMAVFVDDIPLAGADLDTAINPSYIRGIEVYPGSAGVPPRYGASACGTMLVWTK